MSASYLSFYFPPGGYVSELENNGVDWISDISDMGIEPKTIILSNTSKSELVQESITLCDLGNKLFFIQ